MNILILETSTTSSKAMLYNVESKSYLVDVKPLRSNTDDASVHDTEAVFEQTIELGKKLCMGKDVDIISIVTTWHSLIVCDENVKPLSPTYLWSSLIANNICNRLKKNKEYAESYYLRTGCVVSGAYPFFKLLALNLNNSKVKYKILDQGAYTMYRLTGEMVVLESMASGTGWFNVNERAYDKELIKELGIGLHQLPEVVSSDKTFSLSKEGASLLGLNEGTLVIAPGPDGAFNQIGSDALNEGIMTLSVGTSGALRCFSNQPKLSPQKSTWCYALEDGWLVGAATSGACNCVDYMKEKLFSHDITFSQIETWLTEEELMMKDPIFMPFIFGERSPGWNNDRFGGFVFDKDKTELNAHIKPITKYMSTLEGVIFNLYQCYMELLKISKEPIRIKLSGGILHSPYWTQMCGDIFGKTLECDDVQHASLLGGMELAKKVIGHTKNHSINQKTIDDTEIASIGQRIYPDMEKHQKYMKRYKKYLEIYER